MSKSIEDLRVHLFDTLEALKDKEKPMDIDRAKAVAEVAGKIIDSAKVEVDYLRVAGGRGSGFIPQGLLPPTKSPEGEKPRLVGSNKNV